MPHNFIFIAFAMVLPKRKWCGCQRHASISLIIYTVMLNSLLALLNSRDAMRDMYSGQPISIHISKFAASDQSSDPRAHSDGDVDQASLTAQRTHVSDPDYIVLVSEPWH